MKSILDFRPVVVTNGTEPSLRELVYRYYGSYPDLFSEEKVLEYARDYCEQIERQLSK